MVNPDDRTNSNYDVKQTPGRRDQNSAGLASSPPAAPPKANKEFKKVLGDKEDSVQPEKKTDGKKGVQSKQPTTNEDVDIDPDTVGAETATTPSDLYKQMIRTRDGKKGVGGDSSGDLAGFSGDKKSVAKKGGSGSSTALQKDSQGDMSTLNPGLVMSSMDRGSVTKNEMATERTTFESRMATVAKIEELMKTIVDQVNTIKQSGTTYTEVEIKNLKNFEGAKLTLTNYDSDTKSFNIAFTNLSNAGKALIDAHTHELRRMLETHHGFTVHIIIATTQNERIVPSSNPEQAKKEQGSGDQAGDNPQKRRQQPDEEEA